MNHLSDDLLIRHLDDELSPPEILVVEPHLRDCGECRASFAEFRKAAGAADDFFLSSQPQYFGSERIALAQALNRNSAPVHGARAPVSLGGKGAASALRRFSWAAGLAACLAAGFYFSTTHRQTATSSPGLSANATVASYDIDGEKFWALPYSNPDLPVNAPRIVEMEVPIASLADAGIFVAPLASRAAAPGDAVLADVLLGIDGQPVGVHVLSAD